MKKKILKSEVFFEISKFLLLGLLVCTNYKSINLVFQLAKIIDDPNLIDYYIIGFSYRYNNNEIVF